MKEPYYVYSTDGGRMAGMARPTWLDGDKQRKQGDEK